MSTSPSSSQLEIILPSIDEADIMRQAAIGQIQFARQYTLELLDATPRERWFEIPPGGVTHVAWQVGHLAVSQYGLLLFRIRGRRPEDLDLIPGRFRKTYGRSGVPPASGEGQLSPAELVDKLAEVHRLALAEIESIDPAMLLESVELPYAVYPCKLGAILFCPLHESLHAGQIGLTRRLLGLESVR